ncbi:MULTISPECIES: phosphosulfolactate synthase [Methanobacterium]|jgi:phosphosulfolactate synthase|uniref:Phosphosulfolactate synthase n=1 Tax=Methanobacterium veterum TaxID=408577 RepID=A0A9E5A416_9EURY|nr:MULTISPECIES: phosphosulfolactate synthase [Methanobacterium]MCZ3365034.1 phosphosulfolactate synthase [Methanobacterium veterum]MCZ3372789.1 phosphosulfolactate synthase [Methanobacterium veterum]
MKAFNFITPYRVEKPRKNGITMMLDKGMGLRVLEDLMEVSGEYIDFAKLGWGTSALHDRELIQNKAEMYLSYDVNPYPGGTLFELAYMKNKFSEFLDESDKLGFTAIEISDGSTIISPEERRNIISKTKERGFTVISEVGKKNPQDDCKLDTEDRVKLINSDINAGSDRILIEAREGGKGIGIYDECGNIKEDELEILAKTNMEKIIWEAPLKNQQTDLILKFGPNVNLGNIAPEEVTSLETLRRGLRGDTLGKLDI